MNVDLDEQKLLEKMKKAASNIRMTGATGQMVAALARETWVLMTPQRSEFGNGDHIVWRHGYDRKKWPYPKGVVLYWNETQTRVKIKYVNTLFDKPLGEEVENWVYPRELIHIADYVEPEPGPNDVERVVVPEEGSDPGEEDAINETIETVGEALDEMVDEVIRDICPSTPADAEAVAGEAQDGDER